MSAIEENLSSETNPVLNLKRRNFKKQNAVKKRSEINSGLEDEDDGTIITKQVKKKTIREKTDKKQEYLDMVKDNFYQEENNSDGNNSEPEDIEGNIRNSSKIQDSLGISKNLKPKKAKTDTEPEREPEKKVYKGMSSYEKFANVEKPEPNSNDQKVKIEGSAASSIKLSTVFDYKPDICKDYKETGYCGYGDACKFLHDRSDYKSGWQIDREWEQQQAKGNSEDDDDDKYVIHSSESESINECGICSELLEDNCISTKCGHFFHEKCELNRFKKSSKCFTCHKETMGIFNPKKS